MDGISASDEKKNEINILKGRLEELRNEKESMKLEQKKLINSITGLENKIENKVTDINKLLENNEKLRQDNEKLKEEIRKVKDERDTLTQTASEPVILVNEDSSSEEIHYNVSTQNSYAPLQNSEAADSTEERDILVTDVTIIADSHGRSLDAKRMYKNKNVEIKVLDTRKKNLDGAAEFFQSAQTVGKETVIIVGNNYICDNSVDIVIEKFRNVRDQFIEKFPLSRLNIVPVLPRLNNER